ncbi:ptp-2 [Cryptophlebia leucotreta granulovirus]|uniref:Ptp-2 n=1 Tax=Cryptophlebia leucotreta granulosis virus TaxID=35254 RepID=Q7T5K4_GVCL|nr:ptp-2 [Cryptophlebia leucotreta granulovirus]AAQ21684.1 ptp-2 [Cryptophlebia leucotreta granulovirus]
MYDGNFIGDGVFVGGFYGDLEAMLQFVTENNIECVVSLVDSDVSLIKKKLNIKDHIHIFCKDNPSCNVIADKLDMIYNYLYKKINLECKNVLIHCHAGVSRSATVAIYYFMCSKNLSYEEAYNYVNSKRPICPNDHFVNLLINKKK